MSAALRSSTTESNSTATSRLCALRALRATRVREPDMILSDDLKPDITARCLEQHRVIRGEVGAGAESAKCIRLRWPARWEDATRQRRCPPCLSAKQVREARGAGISTSTCPKQTKDFGGSSRAA